MLDTPQIIHTTEQLTAVIRVTIPREKIRNVMGPGLAELLAAVAAQGMAPAGPWFTHHLRMDPAIFDFEIGVPMATAVAAAGRMTPSRLPAVRAARTIYHGGYEGLADAWSEFDRWIVDQGHTPAEDLWECYVAGPELGADSANWRTELTRPLVA